jgi:3,4-dihydroxy 2-butanone 4-phosphate synthase/GTP cyclohydrolase II
MARYGRGLICLTLTRERCQQLRLPLMVSDTDREQAHQLHRVHRGGGRRHHRHLGAMTARTTVRTAVAPDARPDHLRQPGHIFPLMAQPGGVLTRAGHTEAGCDLARLAGLEPAAVIVEIINEDGTMARRPQLETFARQHGLQHRHHRRPDPLSPAHEVQVERITEHRVQTPRFGDFRCISYEDHVHRDVHLALTKATS